MTLWTIVVKDKCKYCTLAKKELSDRKEEVIIISQDQWSGGKGTTYPFIFKDKHFIGGYSDLIRYFEIADALQDEDEF